MDKEEISKRKVAAEEQRKKNLAQAKADYAALTSKDEWPEEEHEERLSAALRCCLFTPSIK